jgi:predicted Zn-dependent protease
MLGRLDEAVSDIEIAVRTDPSQAIVNQNAGRIYLAAGQIDKAIIAFTRVVALAPKNPIGYAHLGIAEVLAGDYNGGISNIEKYLTESGNLEDRAFLS